MDSYAQTELACLMFANALDHDAKVAEYYGPTGAAFPCESVA